MQQSAPTQERGGALPRSRPRRSRPPAWLANLLLLVFGLLVAAVLAEIACRVLEPGWSRAEAERVRAWEDSYLKPYATLFDRKNAPPELLYRMVPGASAALDHGSGPVQYGINTDGFRGPLVARDKPPGAFRVACIGDSVTFGYGVEEAETYVRQLERLLAAHHGKDAAAINLGVNSYGFYQYPALLETVVPNYAPDAVVLQFSVNDLLSYRYVFLYADRFAVGDGEDNEARRHEREQAWLAALPAEAIQSPETRDLPASSSPRIARWPSQRLRGFLLHSALFRQLSAAFEHARIRPGLLRAPHDLEHVLISLADPEAAELHWLAGRVARIATWQRDTGIPVLVLLFPVEFLLYEDTDYSAGWGNLKAVFTDADLEVVDAEALYRQLPDHGLARFVDVSHPDPAGYRILAEALDEALVRQFGHEAHRIE